MMKYVLIILIVLVVSCKKTDNFTHHIYVDKQLSKDLLNHMSTPEKALLCGYLFVYGNECNSDSDKVKCHILNELQIEDECDANHVEFLKKWFINDVIMSLKLQKCPVLPRKFAIQNSIKKIIISKHSDTLSISINVIGMNTSQEKNWNINQTESFIIQNDSFIKVTK
jgi:hypothetical protein